MSEENEVYKSENSKHAQQPIIADAPLNSVTEISPPAKSKNEGITPTVLLLLFAVIALFLVLIFLINNKPRNLSNVIAMDEPSVAALKADIEAHRQDLNRQRIENGLPPLEGGLEPMDDIAARLTTDARTIVSLSQRFQQLLTEKDAQINEVSDELLMSQQARQSLSNELMKLRKEYQNALVASSELANLKMQLETSLNQSKILSDELLILRQQLAESQGSVTRAQYADLEQRYREAISARDFFENRVKELEAQIGQGELFAKSEDELLPAAVELFRRLRTLEGMKDSDLTTEYSKLGVDLGANVLHTLSFATGSSELSDIDRQRVQSVVDEIPDGDLALIIGYASKTGSPEDNQKLSSSRATTGAEYYSEIKRGNQLVQAVYLGQTDRFSSRIPERNQICEIWRIRKE